MPYNGTFMSGENEYVQSVSTRLFPVFSSLICLKYWRNIHFIFCIGGRKWHAVAQLVEPLRNKWKGRKFCGE